MRGFDLDVRLASWCFIFTALGTMSFAGACHAQQLGRTTEPPGAQAPSDVLPDVERVQGIQSPGEFFGFAIGSRHLRHDQIVAYWQHLAANSPRVRLIHYGHTHGRRPLIMAAITSEDNAKQLDELRRQRPRLTSGTFEGKIGKQLLVMLLGYSVHGDESSAVNAAPLVAYHLASARSKQVDGWLQQGVYLVDPALNPDGVDRFANWSNENRGRWPSASSLDREHVQPWPGGRTNYYWFDLNRDWLPVVHPESQGRLRLFHQWKPNVVLDFHEMSGNSSYFFQPGVPARNNPLSPAKNLELTRKFAAAHAKVLDAAGELYYTEERFDDFYMGKGSTYPDLHGAVGILFEQGSTRGLKLRNDRTDRHFRDTVANQIRTSLSSLEVANQSRKQLLRYQSDFYSQALKSGSDDEAAGYLLVGSQSRIDAAGSLLTAHAIDVYQPAEELEFAGEAYSPSQVLIIPCDQPEYTFIRSLLEPLQSFRENIFYDVSTWHLPSAMDVECHALEQLPDGWLQTCWQMPSRESLFKAEEISDEVLGFVFSPVELDAPRLVAALHRAGASLRVAAQPFSSGDQTWPIGSYLLLKQPNRDHWPRVLRTLQRFKSESVSVASLTSGLTAMGPDLGSDSMLDIPVCKPLLVVGAGTRSYSAGALWHFLDVRLGQPCTLVDVERVGDVDLRQFTCVLLPSGTFGSGGQAMRDQLQAYARAGGTIIATGSSIDWLTQVKDLWQAESEDDFVSVPFGEARDRRALESIAGAFFEITIDPTHPLTFGFPDGRVPVFRDHARRYPLPKNPFQVAARYERVLAGYVSERNRKRLAGTIAAWIEPQGRGNYIMLPDNPVFRGYVRSSERLLTNAMYLGPAIRVPPTVPTDEHEHH